MYEYGKGFEYLRNVFVSKERMHIIDAFYAILAAER
jgi:hypothetical protein